MTFVDALCILIWFFFSAFFSGVETGSYTINRIRLLCQVKDGHRSAVSRDCVLKDPYVFVFTV